MSAAIVPAGVISAGSSDFIMNLLNAVFSLVPIQPNDSLDIRGWNPIVWAVFSFPCLSFISILTRYCSDRVAVSAYWAGAEDSFIFIV